ncbi:hypothetical protein LR48_Vigan08g070800 [Vigna angularis]|uniref:Uncharacterized protein n=1 Tax=Phaseolus angularis TaxID=3914 RepID=A0A0L9V4F4_PHAAN|nr:hypothetical protein LR48_Vigan08g070800 [Vigna angularis]
MRQAFRVCGFLLLEASVVDDLASDYPSWHVLGFGYTNVDPQLIKRGDVLRKIQIQNYLPQLVG